MYPPFITQAAADKEVRAETSFSFANAVEEIHHRLYQEALAAVEKGSKLTEGVYYVCQVCGNTVLGEAPERCPICGAPRLKFKKVE
jgi:rubrerythrin